MCHACSRSRQCGSKAELTFLIRVVATGRGVSCRGPLLAQLVGNPEIAGSLELLLLSAQLLVSLYEPASLSHCAPTEHEQVVEALAAGDVERAVAVMTAHLTAIEGRLAVPRERPRAIDLAGALGLPASRT